MSVSSMTNPGPFRIEFSDDTRVPGRLQSVVCRSMGALLALEQLNHIYSRINAPGAEQPFSERALAELDVELVVPDTRMQRIPAAGPLIVIANHPFGGLDGLVLMALLQRIRPDVKLLANLFLRQLPDLRNNFLFVDPFGGPGAVRRNVASLKGAIRWVREGGVLGVFPAGEVSQFQWSRRSVADPPWNDNVARLVRQTGAAVLPVFFEGRNSLLFQTLGLVHPRLRTLMLPRELLNRRHTSVKVRIGSVIGSERLSRFEGAEDLTSYLRARTDILRERENVRIAPVRPAKSEPVTIGPAPEELAAEVEALPIDQQLTGSGEFRALYATAAQIPSLLREIGRLREITFRQVGEGTGKSLDLDEFDRHYLHLFVWHEAKRRVVGAYRMGLTDRILPQLGLDGLYTHTLFRYRQPLMRQIGPAVELGRSFVRPEYQKEYTPLSLLWKGIGHFVAAHPQYKMLFGPVSISNDYQSLTRLLLVNFLRLNRYLPNLGRLVQPRNAPKFGRRDNDPLLSGTAVRDIDEVNELVREIEADRLSVPVLLRQYLKLNAKLLGFNVDPNFGNVLDALMLVDLTQVERPILCRYLGRVGAERFLRYHTPLSH